jgi:hypothetical protein
MNDFELLKQLFKAPKDVKGWFYTILFIVLIVVGLLAIFWPSQKPVEASGECLASGTNCWQIYNFYYDTENENRLTIKWGIVEGESEWASTQGASSDFRWNDSGTYWKLQQSVNDCTASTSTYCYTNFKVLKLNNTPLATNETGLTSSDVDSYLDDYIGQWHISDSYLSIKIVGSGVSDTQFVPMNVFYWGDEEIPTEPTTPNLEITSPPDGSTQTTAFDVVGNYDILEENYDRLMIIFEDWDASSTCPLYSDPDFQEQYSLYFNNQSIPYFSDYFETSTGVATTSISDLAKGNYRCTRCYFINETTGAISSEVCQGYGVNIPNTLPPAGIPSFYTGQNWADFYTTHTEKWATSTELFSYLAGKTAPILSWVGNFTADFKNLFNNASSSAMGVQLGQAIPKARGYLAIINEWFSGLPVGEIFIFYILTALIIIVLKVVLMIWHFFRG